MEQELIAHLDNHFRETSRQLESLREEVTRRFERVEEGIRQIQVVVKELHGEIRLSAEELASFDEELDSFRAAVTWEFCETRRAIRRSQAALNSRVRSLELWRELKERDPIDVLRERYGLGKKTSPTS